MILIETMNKLDKRLRVLLMFVCILVLTIGAIALFSYIQHIQVQQKSVSSEKLVSTLRIQTLKAQADNDLDKADKLYAAA